jgi:hypothetical protein
MLVIEFPEANTRAVLARSRILAQMKPGLSGIRSTPPSIGRRPSCTALDSLRWGLIGLLLVAALLAAFWLSWRMALISVVSISCSLVAAAYLLYCGAEPHDGGRAGEVSPSSSTTP